MILYITLAAIFSLFLFGIFLLIFIFLQKKKLGLAGGTFLYIDSIKKGNKELLSATSAPLFGKPDYLIKQKDFIIPIEKKTGKTPDVPYKNHIAQVIAYCFLTEEHYGIRPPHGVIQYPNDTFVVEYENGAEHHLKSLIQEILFKKKNGRLYIDKLSVCRNCREEKKCFR